MLIESFLKTSLLPAFFLGILCLTLSFMKGFLKDVLQGLLFLGALTLGLWQIKGGLGNPWLGGMEVVVLLPSGVFLSVLLMGFFRRSFLLRFILVLLLMGGIAFPFIDRLGFEFFSFQHLAFRVALAFSFLCWSLWSFSERRFHREDWLVQSLAAMVTWSAAAFFFLFKSSALISQIFGLFATVSGLLLLLSLFSNWRISERVSAANLVTLPILFLALTALYMETPPLQSLLLCLPFLVASLKPYLPFSAHSKLGGLLLYGLLCSMSVAWLVYQAYLMSEPLY